MANDKKQDKHEKNDKKPEAPATVVETKPVSTGTALTVIQKAGLVVPSTDEIAKLEQTSRDKLAAFAALIDSGDLPELIKSKVQSLVAQANPVKPGMEEVTTTWSVARVQIAQPTTQSSAKPESAKQGDLYTTAGQILERPFGFIPIWFNLENIMFKQGRRPRKATRRMPSWAPPTASARIARTSRSGSRAAVAENRRRPTARTRSSWPRSLRTCRAST